MARDTMPEDATVELDIFSGRPNPSWRLGEREQATLLQLIGDLPPASERGADPPGLGYRGLIVRLGEQVLRAFGSTIEWNGGLYRDQNRTVEKLLLESMAPELRAQFAPMLPR